MVGQYIILLAIMFTGYALRKLNVINEAMNSGLNKFILYFAYPCMIVHNIGTLHLNGELIFKFFLMLGITMVGFFIYTVYTNWYSRVRKFPEEKSHVAELAQILPNDGFLGFPVALIFFQQEGMFLMLAHNAGLNLYSFTYGLRLIRRNKTGTRKLTPKAIPKAVLKVLLNPNILAVICGVIISGLNIGIPDMLDQYLLYIGETATPLAMIFIGSTLSECKIGEIIKDRIVIEGTINKLVILPLLTAVVVIFLPIDPLIKACAILGCAFPTGATAPMLTEQEGEDKQLSTKLLFFSTLLSVITIPLIAAAIQKVIVF